MLLQLLAVYLASTSSTVMGRRATSAWMAANRASMVMVAQVPYQIMNRCCICNWGVPLIVAGAKDDYMGIMRVQMTVLMPHAISRRRCTLL